jgi:hypothetical protein
MVLHLSHAEGGFGVTFNDVTKDTAFYTTTLHFVTCLCVFSQERQEFKDDLRDSSSWSSSPLTLLRDIHSNQDGVSQQQETNVATEDKKGKKNLFFPKKNPRSRAVSKTSLRPTQCM